MVLYMNSTYLNVMYLCVVKLRVIPGMIKNINHLIQTIYTVMESPPCTNGITYSICYTSHVMLSCLWYYHCRLIGEI